jgi:hypothetical protein
MEWMRNSLPLLFFTSDISSKGEIKKEKEKTEFIFGVFNGQKSGKKKGNQQIDIFASRYSSSQK